VIKHSQTQIPKYTQFPLTSSDNFLLSLFPLSVFFLSLLLLLYPSNGRMAFLNKPKTSPPRLMHFLPHLFLLQSMRATLLDFGQCLQRMRATLLDFGQCLQRVTNFSYATHHAYINEELPLLTKGKLKLMQKGQQLYLHRLLCKAIFIWCTLEISTDHTKSAGSSYVGRSFKRNGNSPQFQLCFLQSLTKGIP
jgi:hypothetical protein